MATLSRRGTRYLFTTLLLLGILSCAPTIHLTDVAKLRMGMRPDEPQTVMGVQPRDVFQWVLPATGESIIVQTYTLLHGGVSGTYLLAYQKGSLIFWGYPYEFARSSDPLINEIGKKAVARHFKASPPSKPEVVEVAPPSVEGRLRTLNELRKKNLITEEEYQAAKKEVLRKLTE